MAMNLSEESPIAGAGRPRFAARSMKVARPISRLSSWPSNSASFTPFDADAVSNMVVLRGGGVAAIRPTRCKRTSGKLSVRPFVCNDTYPLISANDDERRSARPTCALYGICRDRVLDLTGPLTVFRSASAFVKQQGRHGIRSALTVD